jgi:AcrR family transcriptional regulator
VPARKSSPTPKSEQTRKRILDAAARLFRQKGYSEVTLDRIAAAAGTKAGSLYYYFRSREHLVQEVLALSMERTEVRVRARLAALPPQATFRDRIATAVREHLEQILLLDDYTVAFTRIIDQVPARVRRHAADSTRAYGRLWNELMRGAQKAGELRSDLDTSVSRMLLLGGMTWTLEWYKAGPLSPAQIADHAVTLFFEGMETRKKGGAGRRPSKR